ncbi:MAG: hypothetical protein M3N16_05955 [Actinomycetota bacterium]|nr:hypothetical protein [Actinomycetota bacterium]
MQRIGAALDARPRIRATEWRVTTGSILLRHEQDIDVLDEVRSALGAAGLELAVDVAIAGYPSAASPAGRISDAAGSLDAAVERTTGGLPLRTLVPLGLAALSLRQALRGAAGLKEAPWYVLAWYSFDAFLKLHDREKDRAEATRAPRDRDEVAGV